MGIAVSDRNTMPEYPLEEYARTYPFRYADEDFPNLVRALAHHYPGESVATWALQFQIGTPCRSIRWKSMRGRILFAMPMRTFPISCALWLTTTRARAWPHGHCSFWIRRILPTP